MTEAENLGVIEEAAAPIAEEVGEAHAETQQNEEEAQKPLSDAEINFKRMRESNEQLQRERDRERAEREKDREMFQALLKRSQAAEPTPKEDLEIDVYAGLESDDLLTVEQQRRLDELREQRDSKKINAAIQQALKEDRAKRHKEDAPDRLKRRFQDFDAVVNEENVNKLRDLDPDVAHALSLIGDEEKQAIAAYKYIKAFIPQAVESNEAKKRIEQNASRPKSLSSTGGSSPLSQASAFENGLTPDLKKHLFAEMQKASRMS